MVASIMVIGAVPASAAISTTDSCPTTTPSAGFTDIGGLDATTQLAINCLVNYEISQGTSATTFSPAGEVTRWQMALFLTRQAEVHGVTLPSGAPQGFTDIAGLPSTTQTAINQLAQLEITQGTSATTFSPNQVVTRWQMALFLTRLVAAAGVTLPSGAPQGFTDLGGLSNDAQTAINQVKQIGIADGTSATTYAPLSPVLRWQMALFLTRTLAADGITPPVSQQVVISPTDAATLGAGQAKAYTVTFYNTDGTLYTGRVGVQVHDVNASNAIIYNDTADNTNIESIDGAAVGAPVFSGFPGLDGKVTVVVRHDNAAGEKVRLMAYIDSDSDTNPDGVTGATTPPTEPFNVAGLLTFNVPAAEAATGTPYTGLEIVSVGTGSFVASDAAVNCGNGVGAPCTFFHDADDIYLIGGGASTEADFGAALTAGDTVDVTNYNAGQPSAAYNVTFNLTNDTNPTNTLVVTDPASAIEIDAGTYTVRGTGQVGYVVAVHVDTNMDGNWDAGEVTVGQSTVAADGSWAVLVPLTQGTANHFTATMRATAGTALVANDGVDVPTITEGPAAAALLAPSTWANGGAAAGLNVGDVLTLNFNENVAAPNNGDTVELIDADGTRVKLTCGGNATCAAADSDTITVTVSLFPEIVTTGTTAGLQSPAQVEVLGGFVGTDGLAVNVAGSGANRQLTEA